MKKLFLFFVLIISVSNLAFALKEVKCVETKLVKYNGPEYNNGSLWFGYSFYNNSGYNIISVDAELYYVYINYSEMKVITVLIDTKSFRLKENEDYIWKFEKNEDFRVYGKEEKSEPTDDYDSYYNSYYVKFKTYIND